MPRDLPPLNALRAFESAARHLNFTKASEELFVTQGAVSRQIKQLEEDLRQPLFRRDGPRIELTRVGRNYRDSIVEGLAIIRRGTAEIRRRSTTPALTVSVLPSFATMWLVPRIASFQEDHPELDLRIDSSYEVVDFNRTPDVDVAIRLGAGDWPGVHAECLFDADVFPVCSPALLKGNSPFKSKSDILNYPLIYAIESLDDWERWFAAAELDFPSQRPATRYSDQMSLQQAAIEGQGITLARSLLVDAELRTGRLIKPIDISIRSRARYYFVCPPGSQDLERISTFYSWLKRESALSDDTCLDCSKTSAAA